MELAYVIGPYRAETEWEVHRNIQRAEAAAAAGWRAGFAVICPHKNTGYMTGVVPIERILAGDQAMLAVCNVVILVEKWERSAGSRAEVLATLHRFGVGYYRFLELTDCLIPVPRPVVAAALNQDY